MSNPNPVLSAGQLAIMAVVVLACMAFWLTAVVVAARDPRRHRAEVTPISPPEPAAEETERESAA